MQSQEERWGGQRGPRVFEATLRPISPASRKLSALRASNGQFIYKKKNKKKQKPGASVEQQR